MLTRLVHDERGVIWVWMAGFLPLALILAAFVIDTAKWFEDQRHLQTQVDAAALAGAASYRFPCSSVLSGTPDSIMAQTLKYAGDLNRDPAAYNMQVSDQPSVHVLVNSAAYWSGGVGSDFTDGGDPCTAHVDAASVSHYWVDVKATHDAPSYFFGSIVPAGILPEIHAHARAELVTASQLTGELPLAIPNPAPAAVGVLLVNEAGGSGALPLAVSPLQPGTPSPDALNGRSMAKWTTPLLAPLNLTVPTGGITDIGVVVALSNNAAWVPDGTKSVLANCSQPGTECFIPNGATPPTAWAGISYVRGYDPATPGPAATDVRVANQSCTDASGPYFVLNGGCTVSVRAKLIGVPTGATVKLDAPGCPSGGSPKGCAMTSLGGGVYQTTEFPTIDPNVGAAWLDINWKVSGSTQTIPHVARVYSSDATSDPVEFVQVSEGGLAPANSLASGPHSLSVVVGLQPPLTPSAQLRRLRVADGGGSHTQSLDCDQGPASNFKDEIANGCRTLYQVDQAPPVCHAVDPPDCVKVKTGQTTSISQGLDQRFISGGTCAPNNWNGDPTHVSLTDPRTTSVIVTSFGAFDGSGASNGSNVPVIGFAYFYIAGWGGAGSQCNGINTPFPGAGTSDIWGYYVQENTNAGGGVGTTPCSPGSINPCEAVLTN